MVDRKLGFLIGLDKEDICFDYQFDLKTFNAVMEIKMPIKKPDKPQLPFLTFGIK